MSEHPLDFDTFARVHPRPHVVVGKVAGDLRSTDLSVLHRQLRHLIKSQGIAGDYATGLVRTADETEIQCRFANLEDAVVFGACFNARHAYGDAGFATRRRFVLDDAVREGLRSAVAATRRSPSTHRGRRKEPHPQDDVLA